MVGKSTAMMKYVHITLALIYCSLGLWFITANVNLFEVPLKQQKIAGGIFILYSIYRSYRIYQKHFRKDELEK